MGPQTGFTGSAFSTQTNFAARVFRPERPLRLGKSAFGGFRPVPGCERGREIYRPLDPPKTSKPRMAAAGGQTIGSRGRMKVAQRERASDEPKNS